MLIAISAIGDEQSKNHGDVRPWALDVDTSRRLWELSEALLEMGLKKESADEKRKRGKSKST